MNSLQGKVIVITGGNGLLGKEIISFIESFEATVVNADISFDNTTLKGNTIKCDITSRKSVQFLIKQVIDNYGRIDGWVNNAYPRTKDWGNKFDDISEHSWRTNVDLQMNSVFIACQEIIQVMKKQKSGSIVNIASIYGVIGPNFDVYKNTEMTMPAAYSAIKGGIINFSRYLASLCGPLHIRVNCVSPGGILDNQNPIFIKQYAKNTPLGRMGLSNEIAPSVAFLLSDYSSYITGQNLIVDGGWTIK